MYYMVLTQQNKAHYTSEAGSAMALPFLQYIVVAMCREKAATARN
jgi:hypothetical protein